MRRYSRSGQVGLHKGLRPRQFGLPVNVHPCRQSAGLRRRRIGSRYAVRPDRRRSVQCPCLDVPIRVPLAGAGNGGVLVQLPVKLCSRAQPSVCWRLLRLRSGGNRVLSLFGGRAARLEHQEG